MTLGEIKIEALKLMFVNGSTDITIDQIDINADEKYQDYLVNMTGAINRCFANLEERGVLPSKTYTLVNGTTDGAFTRFDLTAIPDYHNIERLIYINGSEYINNCDFQKEGDTLVIQDFEDTYKVVYKPKIARITSATENSADIGVPDYIAAHIPYFIKGDLYREDEPDEAGEARNWYESAMESINKREHSIGKVVSIYSQTE